MRKIGKATESGCEIFNCLFSFVFLYFVSCGCCCCFIRFGNQIFHHEKWMFGVRVLAWTIHVSKDMWNGLSDVVLFGLKLLNIFVLRIASSICVCFLLCISRYSWKLALIKQCSNATFQWDTKSPFVTKVRFKIGPCFASLHPFLNCVHTPQLWLRQEFTLKKDTRPNITSSS